MAYITYHQGKQKLKISMMIHLTLQMAYRFFSGLKSLEYLNLSGNAFSSLPPILSCPRLQWLILHSNKIHTLPSLPLLNLLHTLDLSCNQFETVPQVCTFS